jgi:hypothetical protein
MTRSLYLNKEDELLVLQVKNVIATSGQVTQKLSKELTVSLSDQITISKQ